MGPADPVFSLGISMASDMAAAYVPTPAETGATDYIFIVTDPDSLIIGSSADGSFDFSAYPVGTYGYTGFAYNQSQLVTLAQTLDALPAATLAGLLGLPVDVVIAIQAAIDPATVTIDDFLYLLDQLSTSPQTVATVATTLDGIACGGTSGAFVAACFATTVIPAYTVEVIEAAGGDPDECDVAASLDLAAPYQGPFNNESATATEALDPAIIDACFPFSGGDDAQNSLWYTFVGDGGTYHIFTSADCGGGLNLVDEDVYVPFGDTQMLLFSGACDALQPLSCNEDDYAWGASDTDYFAGLSVATEPGVTYYLWVDGFQGSAGSFCIQVVPEPCGNIEFTSEAAATSLCPDETIAFDVNADTYNAGSAPDAQSVVFISTGTFDAGLGSYTVALPPVQLTGNADGTFTFTDQNDASVTVSEINITGAILSGGGGIDFACSTNTTPTYTVTFLNSADPACGGGDPCAGLVPANDNCPNALELTIVDGYVNGPYTNNCASGEGALPADISDCFGDYEADATAHDSYDNSVWFMFVGDGSTVTLTTNVDGVTNPIEDGDTQLAVFEGACDGPSVGCNDDIDFDASNYASSVTVVTVPGVTYYVVVDGFFTGDGFYPDFYSNGEFNIAIAKSGGDPLTAGLLQTTTDEVTNTYVVSMAVTGGTAPYSFSDSNVSGIGGDFYVSGAIACGTDYSVVVTDAAGASTVLTVTAPCDVITPSCLANYGTVTPPAVTEVCAGGTGSAIGIEGDNTDGFQTIFVVTDGMPNLNILGASLSNTINFGALDFPAGASLGAGTYTIHAFNFDMTQTSAIVNALLSGDISTGFEAQAAIDAGIICGELDPTGFQMSVASAISISYDIICDPAAGESTIAVNVSGGLPALSGAYEYTYSGILAGSSSVHGTSFSVGPITDGQGFTLTATDLCGSTTVDELSIACTKCDFSAGFMSPGLVTFCGGEPISVPGSVGYNAEGGVIIYVLHTSADTTAGTIIATDLDATDGTADFGVVALNGATYYVSAVVGKDEDGDGVPDFNDECTRIAAGTPVSAGSSMTLNVDEVCNTETGTSTLTIVTMGGSGNYSLVWNNGSDAEYTGSVSYADVVNGTYTFTVTDDACGDNAQISQTISLNCIKGDDVSWLPLTGEVLTQGNMLRWGTASENENDYFRIERSKDGISFEAIGTVDGAGNSIQALSYEYMDKTAPVGMVYYRVVQVDFDNSTDASNVITLVRGESAFGLVSVSPVPAVNTITLTYSSPAEGNVSINVIDATGKVVAQLNNETTHGLNNVEININNFASGVYFVQVSNGAEVTTGKFIKE